MAFVALLAEGVDRNQYPRCHLCIRGRVALLAEGVDRNQCLVIGSGLDVGRPPRGGRG